MMMDTREGRTAQALARSCTYRFLSTLFVYPDDAAYAAVQGELTRATARSLALLRWEVSAFAALQEILRHTSREQLEAAHVAVFGHTAAGKVCPYEARYGSHHLFQETECLADVAGFYRAFSLEPATTCRERPDHIAVELEFMHALGAKEAYALDEGWMERAEICREAQVQFLRDHLGRWAPSFLDRLATVADGGTFAPVATVTAACLTADCHRLGVPVGPGELEPSAAACEPEGSSFTCGAGVTAVGMPADAVPQSMRSKEEVE
ncbi:MAG: molecular chaperone [Candidatus Binatia bacterium]